MWRCWPVTQTRHSNFWESDSAFKSGAIFMASGRGPKTVRILLRINENSYRSLNQVTNAIISPRPAGKVTPFAEEDRNCGAGARDAAMVNESAEASHLTGTALGPLPRSRLPSCPEDTDHVEQLPADENRNHEQGFPVLYCGFPQHHGLANVACDEYQTYQPIHPEKSGAGGQ